MFACPVSHVASQIPQVQYLSVFPLEITLALQTHQLQVRSVTAATSSFSMSDSVCWLLWVLFFFLRLPNLCCLASLQYLLSWSLL